MLDDFEDIEIKTEPVKEQFLGTLDNFFTDDSSLLTCWTEEQEEETTRVKKPSTRSLRAISQTVLDLIQRLRITTYQQIAEKIILEQIQAAKAISHGEKNVRRRVYDCLNVLISANVIDKIGKRLTVANLTTETSQRQKIEKLKSLKASVQGKRDKLNEVSQRFISFKSLLDRNRKFPLPDEKILDFPYVLLATSNDDINSISIKMNAASSKVWLSFAKPVEIVHDMESLKKIKIMRRMDELPQPVQAILKNN